MARIGIGSLRFAGVVLATALLLPGCGGGDEPASPPPPAVPDTPAPAPPMPAPEPAATAPAAAAADSATGSTAGDAEAGAEIYATNCATCHGPEGGGDGPLSAALDPRPAAHDDGSYMNGLSDEYLAQVIREGGAAVGKSALMAPWRGMLSDQDIADVIAFIRTLADPPYVPAGE